MSNVQISQAVANQIEKLRAMPFYAEQQDTDGAIIQVHAETFTPHSSWGKGNPLHEEKVSTGVLARALLNGYEIVNY